ncbi:hypothetical protein TNCV_4330311 [Trichonephila clavipes]|nr:hypothetical protein TNCV_4330311 [Trichonephila clavipes]
MCLAGLFHPVDFHATRRPEEYGLLNTDQSKHDWSHAVYRRVPIQLQRLPDVFLYGGTGGTRNNPHSFVKGHNTEELVGWYEGGISILGGHTDLHIIQIAL